MICRSAIPPFGNQHRLSPPITLLDESTSGVSWTVMADEKQLEILKSGVMEWNNWRDRHTGTLELTYRRQISKRWTCAMRTSTVRMLHAPSLRMLTYLKQI
jgi:hypothetical protein